MTTKVHKVTLIIIDDEQLGEEEISAIIENQKYPNHCISPLVYSIDTKEIEWNDDHPLNKKDTYKIAFKNLFNKE